jgi:hypothetical protein
MRRRTAPKTSAKAETYEHKDKDALLGHDLGLSGAGQVPVRPSRI